MFKRSCNIILLLKLDTQFHEPSFRFQVVGMTEELTTLNGEDKVVTPATLPRQKEILAA